MTQQNLEEKIGLMEKIRTNVEKSARIYVTAAALSALSIVGYGCGPDTCIKDSDCKEGSYCQKVCHDQYNSDESYGSTNETCYHTCQHPETTTTWVSDED